MNSDSSTSFATRLPADEAALVEAALAETDQQAADLVCRAVQYYIRENPDGIVAFCPDGSLEQFWLELI